MPLRDHFHPPLREEHRWESFHGAWATEIMRLLNRGLLPRGYLAEVTVSLGSHVQVDVGTFERDADAARSHAEGNGGGVAVQTWAPPAPLYSMDVAFEDVVSVQVFQPGGGFNLVGAIELVSPRNKDRPGSRAAFAAKCTSYLRDEVGLIVVDIVTDRRANLHDELMRLLEQPAAFAFDPPAGAYAVAYRPRPEDTHSRVDMWPHRLELGQPLPTLPLAVRGLGVLPIDLETTYDTTCRDSRIGE
jgi:hypothetical protein